MRSEPTRREYLRIRTLQWKWDSADLNFYLVGGMLKVEEYNGRVPLEELGIIPMALMESAETDIRRRLIFRGKLYKDLFISTRSLWGYHGPATRHSPRPKRFTQKMGTKLDSLEDEDAAITVWRPIIKTRVVVSIFIPQTSPYDVPTPYELDLSEPMHDETYMICSSILWVQPVKSLSGPPLMVHLDHLSPVAWNELSFNNNGDEKICAKVLSTLRIFRPLDKAQARLEGRPAGLIMIAHGDMIRAISIMGVAEHDKRALLEIDLLDLIRNTRNIKDEDGLFRVLQGRLNLATHFIEMLETYSEIVVLCLEKDDTIDGKLRKLEPVYVNMDDDTAE
ncbi:hypothetical protein CcaCcLH18_02957 [Colletotrichum camelliae]|nr:hypothetical protein CcaCcLH18_02957 [Colletotrichum camelliae]